MNQGALIFLGLFVSMSLSWYGLIFKSHKELGHQAPVKIPETGAMYPLPRNGLAQQGLQVYRKHGCATCHTQQVRSAAEGSDIQRGWGIRHTVAQDYLYDDPPMLGSVRIGPDLANVGARLPDEKYHLSHLYAPADTVVGSKMPPYPFLFEKRRVYLGGSPDALPVKTDAGFEIVPRPEAKALAAYLLSLKSDVSLFEAPVPKPKTNDVSNAASPAAAK